MHLHTPDIDDAELPVTMNPGSGKPFGFIHFGNTHHCANLVLHSDEDADRLIRAAVKHKAMRAMLGKPHPFTSAQWSGPSGGHCDQCGMLSDSPDHTEPEPLTVSDSTLRQCQSVEDDIAAGTWPPAPSGAQDPAEMAQVTA